MNNQKDKDKNVSQTAENTSGNAANPFENGVKVDQEVQLAQEELEKEQQFKEAQTERD